LWTRTDSLIPCVFGGFTVITTESPTFLKIPTQCEGLPTLVLNDYGRYLIFKSWGKQGVITKPTGKYRCSYYSWMKKMVSRGWAYRLSDGSIQLRSYQHVWSTLGAVRTKRKKSKTYGYQYTTIWEFVNNEALSKSCHKELVKEIRLHIAARKVRQITFRLINSSGVNLKDSKKVKEAIATVSVTEKPMLSCQRVAEMFGYRSATSVYKAYGEFFSKVDQPHVLEWRISRKTKKMARLYPCNRIYLK
jgi:hypothetical protein